MEKPEKFKQPTPAMQHVSLMNSLRGEIDNFAEGIITKKGLLNRMMPILDDMDKLTNWHKETWE